MTWVLICCVLTFTSILMYPTESCEIPECAVFNQVLPPKKMFRVNDSFIPFQGRAELIPDPNVTECTVNLTQIMLNMFQENVVAVGVMALYCKTPVLVHFSDHDGEVILEKVWFYLQVVNCHTTLQSFNRISEVTDLKTMTLASSYIHTDNNNTCFKSSHNQTYALKRASSIWIMKPDTNDPHYMTQLFCCNETFPNLMELSLQNVTVDTFMDSLPTLFPNLQSLELSSCNLASIPPFPWTLTSVDLPRNLEMGSYFLTQYADTFNIQLNPRQYRRALNLNGNHISRLSRFQFSGLFDMIQLARNKIEEIDETAFWNVMGIQHIDLSENNISLIHNETFRGLRSLRHLNIRGNNIKFIPVQLFDDLDNLVYLNLGHNSIQNLTKGVFSNLLKVEQIHLDHNNLVDIPVESFGLFSLHLHTINLDYNPFTVIPEVVFYFRKLEYAFLRHTYITFNNLTELETRVSWSRITDAVVKSASSEPKYNLMKSPDKLRIVDLSGSLVSVIRMDEDISIYADNLLQLLFKHFHFVLNENPITCDCSIVPFYRWTKKKMEEDFFKGDEYFFQEWQCSLPLDLKDRKVLGVKPEETYCEVNITDCPLQCKCYERTISGIIMVDCQGRQLDQMPETLPEGSLELFFNHNNITVLENRPYLSRVKLLYLNNNKIDSIKVDAIDSLVNVRKLYLNSNLLAYVPHEIRSLRNTSLKLGGNPLKCDCHTLWMKRWIQTRHAYILDWGHVACNTEDDEGQQFLSVPDEEFICVEEFDSVRHLIIPAVASSLCLSLLIISLVLLYIYRLEVKVLMYIHLGLHPFDRDEKDGKEEVDALIVHAPQNAQWVMENLVRPLEDKERGYVLCTLTRDFIAGFSFQENIVSIVRRSKRMILVISNDMMDTDDLFKVAWNEAQDKIKECRTNYVIAVSHNVKKAKLTNKDFLRYIKRGKLLHTSESFFKDKVLYSMSHTKEKKKEPAVKRQLPDIRESILAMYENNNADRVPVPCDVFLTYGDRDRNFAINDLRRHLEQGGLKLLVPDRDFMAGGSKEENILRAISMCTHTLFLFSGDYLQDEWSLFTFRTAIEQSLRKKCNHLIVITTENGGDFDIIDEEVKYYLQTHVTLCVQSEEFWDRLNKSLPPKHPRDKQIHQNGHTRNGVNQTNMYINKENNGRVNEDKGLVDKPNENGKEEKNENDKQGDNENDKQEDRKDEGDELTVTDIIRARQKERELQIEADIQGVDFDKIIFLHNNDTTELQQQEQLELQYI